MASFSPQSILVVDDRPQNLQLIVQYLNNAEYKVFIAQDGIKAVESAITYLPDLILMDVMMPGVDGFTACSHLKSNARTQDIPLIFMTALSEIEDKIEGFRLGAVDYITKPINREELLARIKTHLSLQNLLRRSIRDANRQKLLFEISDRIRQCQSLKSIKAKVTQEIKDFLNCENVLLTRLDRHDICLEAFATSKNTEPEQTISREQIVPNPGAYLSYQQGNISIVDLDRHCQLSDSSDLLNRCLRIILPIIISRDRETDDRNNLWGWLIIDYNRCTRWQTEEIDNLKVLTNQLAIGIQQALLYERISQQALVDSLTKIYNRRYFDLQLEKEWRRLKRNSSDISLIFCDLDYFKVYNDTYGHQQGDKCLQQVAKALASAIKRPADVLARYGGEEFVAILPETFQAGAIKVAEDMRSAVKKLNIPHLDSVVTISVGVAHTIPNSKDNSQLLIEAADLALYEAKERGRNCVVVYSQPISNFRNREESEASWVKRLHQALQHNLFSLYAQPITSLNSGEGKQHFEILLRLVDLEDVVTAPNSFLDIAERNFLMAEIDTWAIDNLFKTLTRRNPSYWQNYQFSINLSRASLDNDLFLQFVSQKIADYNLSPELFCFEIAETVAVSEIDKVSKFVKSLKDFGCSFALDNFGKNMFSLTHLNSLPVDYLKIDGSVIGDFNRNQAAKVMIAAINHIAEGVGFKTVAKFVENQSILNALQDLKVDYAQGYYLGRPEELTRVIFKD